MNENSKDEIYAAFKAMCRSKLILTALDIRIGRAMERGKDIEGMIESRVELVLDGQVRLKRLYDLCISNKMTSDDVDNLGNKYLMERCNEGR